MKIVGFSRNMSSLAEKKFWTCPELLEKTLLSLDTDSLKSLAKAHEPVNTVLGKTLWALLIKQVTTMRGRLRNSRDLHSFGFIVMKNQVVQYTHVFKFLKRSINYSDIWPG